MNKLTYPGGVVTIDDEEYVTISPWHWRIQRHQNGKLYAVAWDGYPNLVFMHRIIMGEPISKDVHHVNGDTLDNRKQNLLIATRSQNVAAARPALGKTSEYKGVHWDSARGKWKAMIKANGKHHFLGRYINEEDAARRYNEAAIEFFGEFAYVNEVFGEE